MRTLANFAATLGVVGAIAVSNAAPAVAWYGDHHRYYNYYGGYYPGADPNGCPPGYSLQGGNCALYKGPRGPFVPPGARYPWQ